MNKYVVVSFIKLKDIPELFPAANWPLHCTLLGNFSTKATQEKVIDRVEKVAISHEAITIEISKDTLFGPNADLPVSLVLPTRHIHEFHISLTSRLEPLGITYDHPQYIHAGYRPHITVQEEARVSEGDIISIDNIALVDVTPEGNETQRKVIKYFKLKASVD